MREVDPKVDEAIQTLNMKDGPTRRKLLTGTGLVSATAAASALLAACSSTSSSGSTSTSPASSAAGNFPTTPPWKFTFVNHVTTNPFFVPTQYGLADAAALLGLPKPAWTGSENSSVPEMVSATNAAISSKANGIAVAVISSTAFTGPVNNAMNAGIPVVSYNADGNVGDPGTNRLAYIGQDLFVSGQEMGKRIAELVPSGDVALFIATPGSANIQPRIDGAKDTLKSHSSITPHTVATGAAVPAELSTIDAYATGHPDTKGYFAVDAGSTQSVAQTIQKHNLRSKGVKGGGYDLTPVTQKLLAADQIDFTIDQQPYLQGFFPVLELYLYKASQSLSGIADINTGLKFLDKTTVVPYNSTKSRYEGTSSAPGVQQA
jgi:simple sugar transport system substrate-binding protein